MGHRPTSRRARQQRKDTTLRRRRIFASSLSLLITLSLMGLVPAAAEGTSETTGDDAAVTDPVDETTPSAEEETTPPADETAPPEVEGEGGDDGEGEGEGSGDEGESEEPPAEESLGSSSDEVTPLQLGALAALLEAQAQVDADICTGSDCQIIRVHKEGLRDVPLEDATFGIWATSNTAGAPLATCTTGAGGSCDFEVNRPSFFDDEDYWVRETASPSPYNEILTMEVSGTDDYEEEITVEGSDPSGTVYNSRDFVNWRDNPGFPTVCGIDIAVIVDRSNSIDSGELGQMKTAANSFVDALTGTPSEVAVYSFGTDAATNLTSTSVSTVGGANTVKAAINGLTTGGGGTNWDQAFRQVAAGADVVLMLTDGNPTFWGTPGNIQGPGNAATFDTVGEGVLSANAVKAAGAKIVGVGIGSGLSTTNLQLISGPTQNDDWYDSDFATLAATLQEIATRTCGGTLTVVKEVPDGQGGWEPASGWHFDTDPVAATETPANGNTDANGTVNFDFDNVNTVDVDLTEVVQPGWSLSQQGGQNAVCTKNGNPVGSTNIANGVNVDVGPTDIVSCVVRNEQVPGQITIVKDADPADDTTFDFTGDLGAFSLQDPSDDTEGPVSLPAGQYTIDETVPGGWDLESVTCEGAASWNESGDGVVVNLASGEDVECTFHNDRLPQPGSVTVKKKTIGGTGTFDFTLTGQPGASATTTNETDFFTASPVWNNLAPGNYTLDELGVIGWVPSTFTCTNQNQGQASGHNPVLQITDGENWTCEITNRKAPKVTVEKVTEPAGGTGFPFTVDPPVGPNRDFDLADGDADEHFYAGPGTFTVTEDLTGLTGWELSDVECDPDISSDIPDGVEFDLDWGDEVTCTFNNSGTGSVKVIKDTNPDGLDGTFPVQLTGPSYDESDTLTTDGDMHTFLAVPAGVEMTLVENLPPDSPWTNTDLTCDNDDGTFSVPVGQEVVCTVTNVPDPGKVVVTKVTDPEGLAGSFPINLTDGNGYDEDGTLATPDGDPVEFGNVPLQTPLTLTENLPQDSPWTEDDIDCGDGVDPGAIEVQPGETVNCVITNVPDDGTVIVQKVTVPAGLNGPFEATLSGGPDSMNDAQALAGDGSEYTWTNVPAGTGYDLIETDTDGFGAVSYSCTDSDGVVPNEDFTLEAGDTVTCVITNSEGDPGHVKVIKVTDPEGLTGDFQIDLNGPGGAQSHTLTGDGDMHTFDVPAGTGFSVDEVLPAGWNDYTIDCGDGIDPADFDVQTNQTVECTVTNTPNPGKVIVTKVIEPQGLDGSFPINLTDGNGYDEDGTLATPNGDPVMFGDVPLQTPLALTEQLPPDSPWTEDDIDCGDGVDSDAIEVQPGETVECEITNVADPGTITVKKVTTTPNGDDETEFTFTGSAGVPDIDPLTGGDEDSVEVEPGQVYTVSEEDPGAEWLLYDIECTEGGTPNLAEGNASFDVGPGETVECTFYNGQAEIEVAKTTVTESSDTPDFGFDGDITTDLIGGESASEYVGAGSTDAEFTTTEGEVDGWQLTDITCGDGGSGNIDTRTATYTVQAGDSVSCTFENTQDAEIKVAKTTIPEGSPQGFDFDLSVGQAVIGEIDGVTDGQTESFGNVDPDETYTVSEDDIDGWQQTDADCQLDGTDATADPVELTPKPGEVWTCTFENTQEGSITVVKDTGGIEPTQEFPFTFQGDPFTLVDQESQTFSGLLPGDYDMVEPSAEMPEYWLLAQIDCVSDQVGSDDDDIEIDAALEGPTEGPAGVTDIADGDGVKVALAAGENVTCTFANVQAFPAPGVVITKTPSIESGSPGDTVTYTYVVENTGQARLDNVEVVDDKLGEITLDKTTLEPGEIATGTKDYVLQASDVGNLVNVAVVTADPEGGQPPVTSEDDAVVEVVEVLDQPPVTNPPTQTGSLPFTGATIAGMLLAALALITGGSFLWGATKRRREARA